MHEAYVKRQKQSRWSGTAFAKQFKTKPRRYFSPALKENPRNILGD
jgi:hypothetical protein